MTRRALAPALFALLAACNSTSGQLFEAPFAVGGVARDAGGPFSFTTPLGWQVTLDQAVIALGPFYFNIQPPQTATLRSGTVIYQVTSQVMVNPLDPTLYPVDGGGDGITGEAVAVEIDLFPPDPTQTLENQNLLDQSSAFLSGTASLPLDGGLKIFPFAGFITINQSLATNDNPLPALQRVNGADCDLTFTTAPSAVQLRVDPPHWFDSADFSSLSLPIEDGGPYSWDIRSTFHAQVLNGIYGQTGVYLFGLVDAGS